MKNNTLAMDAAPAAMPVKPKIAAMIAITIKITAHLSIINIFNNRGEIKKRASCCQTLLCLAYWLIS